jgi:hypothetical protein
LAYNCHNTLIEVPADLEGQFDVPPSISHFHELIERLTPVFKQILAILKQRGATKYLATYKDEWVIAAFVNFINRKQPKSSQTYWQSYSDGVRKYAFPLWLCGGFRAYCSSQETKASLQRQAKAIEARMAARLAAGRKAFLALNRDPHGYFTPPTPPATPTEAAMTNAAKETCRKMIAETQQRVDIMLEDAERKAAEIIARAHAATASDTIRLVSDDGDEGNPTIDMGPIRFISDEDNEDNK